ncbi:Uncharacterised protein r2_g1657 [Pycnogonum litorale]
MRSSKLKFVLMITELFRGIYASPAYVCSNDLGLSYRDVIPDVAFTSSEAHSSPEDGRFDNNNGSWRVNVSNKDETFKPTLSVDLGKEYFVSVILWQGPPTPSEYTYKIALSYALNEPQTEEDWKQVNIQLLISAKKDVNAVTETKPPAWSLTRLRYLRITITDVHFDGNFTGGRLGAFGCPVSDFAPQVNNKNFLAFESGSAEFIWTKPVYRIEYMSNSESYELTAEKYRLTCTHLVDGPVDYMKNVTTLKFQIPRMELGTSYNFTLECIYQDVFLDCGSYNGDAYPNCPSGWEKRNERCYKIGENKATLGNAIEYCNNSVAGLPASYTTIDEVWLRLQASMLKNFDKAFIIDSDCNTGCCLMYDKNNVGESKVKKSCDASANEATLHFLCVRYIKAIVSEISEIKIATDNKGDTVVIFDNGDVGWTTDINAKIVDSSGVIFVDRDLNKTETQFQVSSLLEDTKFRLTLTPFVNELWRFPENTVYFVNTQARSGKRGSFQYSLEVEEFNQWDGTILISGNEADIKTIDNVGNITSTAAVGYILNYTVYSDGKELVKAQINSTAIEFSVDGLTLPCSIQYVVYSSFGKSSFPCYEDIVNIDVPKVVTSNPTHFTVYEYHKTGMNWFDAEEHCQHSGGHLSSVTSLETTKPIKALVDDISQMMIGIRICSGDKGRWTDGSLYQYQLSGSHLIYSSDKCCGSVMVSSLLQMEWIACDKKHEYSCMITVEKPQLRMSCRTLSTTDIECTWSQIGNFFVPKRFDIVYQSTDGINNGGSIYAIETTSKNISNLKPFIKYEITISTLTEGFDDSFENKVSIYTAPEQPIYHRVDGNGTLTIIWQRFVAWYNESEPYNLTYYIQGSQKEQLTELLASNPLLTKIYGLLYGNSYTFDLIGLDSNNGLVTDQLNLTLYSDCPKGQIKRGSSCFEILSGDASDLADRTTGGDKDDVTTKITVVLNVTDMELDKIANNNSQIETIWIGYNNSICCYLEVSTANTTCSANESACAENRTIIYKIEYKEPKCPENYTKEGDYCYSVSFGNATDIHVEAIDTKNSGNVDQSTDDGTKIVDINDLSKEEITDIFDEVLDDIIWTSYNNGTCCYINLTRPETTNCSSDKQMCSQNHTIVVKTEMKPKFCELKSANASSSPTIISIQVVKSSCWGNHYTKVTMTKVSSTRRKRSTPVAIVTQNTTILIESLAPETDYNVKLEPSTQDGITSDDPSVATILMVSTAPPGSTDVITFVQGGNPKPTSSVEQTTTNTQPASANSFMKIMERVEEINEPMIAMRIAACTVLIVCVGVTLILFIYSRMFYLDSLCMLSGYLSIIGAFVSVLLGSVEAHHVSFEMCLTMAAFMQYFFLSVFMFFLLEIMCISRLLSDIPNRKMNLRWWQLFIVGWGIPAIILAITLGVEHDEFTHAGNCWLYTDGNSFLPIIIPGCIILIVSVFFILIIMQPHELDPDDMQKCDYDRAKECLRTRWSVTALFLVTVTTWILGVTSENHREDDVYVAFVVVSGLLGICTLIFRCASEVTVRDRIAAMCCCLPQSESNSYKWGSFISNRRVSDIPRNKKKQIDMPENILEPDKRVKSMTSIRSQDSLLSTRTTSTTATRDTDLDEDESPTERSLSSLSIVPPLRRKGQTLADYKRARMRPGTAAVKRV